MLTLICLGISSKMVTLTLISTDADVETLCLYNIQPQLLTAHAHAREVYTLHVAWHDPHYDGPWVLFPRCFSSMIKPDYYYYCDCRLQSTEPQQLADSESPKSAILFYLSGTLQSIELGP